MKFENEKFFENNYFRWQTFSKAQIIRDFSYSDKKRMLDIIVEEFSKNYTADLECDNCIADMIKFGYYHYNTYVESKKANDNKLPTPVSISVSKKNIR